MDATINKALVAQTLAEYCPVGDHSHDDRSWGYGKKSAGGSTVRRKYKGEERGGWPRQGGRLKKFTAHIPNWKLKDKGKSCYIVYFLPYVRIINWGGGVAGINFGDADQNRHVKSDNWGKLSFERTRRTINRYWLMHWADGSSVFRAARKGYNIAAQHFLEKGLTAFAQRAGNLNITWAKGTDTA